MVLVIDIIAAVLGIWLGWRAPIKALVVATLTSATIFLVAWLFAVHTTQLGDGLAIIIIAMLPSTIFTGAVWISYLAKRLINWLGEDK